jgi:hypothetical protein
MSTNHIASAEIATQTTNTSLSLPNLSYNAVIGDPLLSNVEPQSFDLITNLVTSPVTLANELVQPKILKMIDSIQNFLDLNNEKLIEQIGKNREHQLIDLAKKSSDLNHRQKLQSLLIESIGLNDFRKASFIFSYLNENNSSTQFAAINELNSQTISDENTNNFNNREVMDENETFMNDLESSPNKNESYNKNNNHTDNASNGLIIDYEDDLLEIHSHLHHQSTHLQNNYNNSNSSSNSSRCSNFNNNKLFTNAHNSSSSISAVEYNSINLNDSIRDAFSKAKKSNPLSPIRHLICSPGLLNIIYFA